MSFYVSSVGEIVILAVIVGSKYLVELTFLNIYFRDLVERYDLSIHSSRNFTWIPFP